MTTKEGVRRRPAAGGRGGGARFTPVELRDAYFAAAKRCHPDTAFVAPGFEEEADGGFAEVESAEAGAAQMFIRVTEAYELLREHSASEVDGLSSSRSQTSPFEAEAEYISKSEDEDFRAACRDFLGVDAEIVEESKRCPIFRNWLQVRSAFVAPRLLASMPDREEAFGGKIHALRL